MGMSSDVTKAMILAAGEGTRLRPLTFETPKVLLPVAGRPLVEYTIAWLRSHGISQVAVNLYHLGDKIRDFLGDGSRFGMEIIYSPEETLLGTAGGVKRMESFFSGTFVIVYGDVLTDFNLSEMIAFHKETKAKATLSIFKEPERPGAGIIEMDNKGRILSFVEKPPPSSTLSSLSNGGIYILEKEVLNYVPGNGSPDFAYDVFPKLIELNLSLYGYILKTEDYLIDTGTTDKYQKANEDVKAGKVKINRG